MISMLMYYGEKFNSISHLVGAALALVGLGALLAVSIPTRDIATICSFSIFGATLVMLYTTSTLYHSFHPPRLKRIFQKLDHAAIYLLIAGTYTPYLVVSLGNDIGYVMLTIVWGLALCGLLLDLLSPRRIEVLQVSIYLFMGWICVFRFSVMVENIPLTGMIWLAIGGLAYTIGVIFYVLDGLGKLKHAHGIWHLFVLTGSITHFVSIIGYVR
jgi:hemolysin III